MSNYQEMQETWEMRETMIDKLWEADPIETYVAEAMNVKKDTVVASELIMLCGIEKAHAVIPTECWKDADWLAEVIAERPEAIIYAENKQGIIKCFKSWSTAEVDELDENFVNLIPDNLLEDEEVFKNLFETLVREDSRYCGVDIMIYKRLPDHLKEKYDGYFRADR